MLCFFSHFSVKIYLPPDLPRNYRPVHYFRPVIAAGNENYHLQKALEESTGKLGSNTTQQSRHALNASQRREQLGEAVLKGIDGYHTFACFLGPQIVYVTIKICFSLERYFLM